MRNCRTALRFEESRIENPKSKIPMTFSDAAAISATGLPIRRTGWSDTTQWFTCWRGFWWYQNGMISRPVEATD